MPTMHYMISRGLSTPSIIASSTSLKYFLRHPEVILWVLRAIRLLKQHLNDFDQVDFSMPWMQKWFRMSFWHLETSLHGLQQSRFITRPEGRLLFQSPITYLKHHLSDFVIIRFSMPRMHKMNSKAFWLLENRFIDITKVVFSDVQKAYYFSGPFIYLKHHLSEFVKIGFFDTEDAENDFAWPSDI
jgi:hypothetical protein